MKRRIGILFCRLAHRFFPELTFNQEMSREIDRLQARIEELERGVT